MSDPRITPEQIARAFDVPLWVVGIGDPPPPPTGWRKVRVRTARAIQRAAYRVETAAWRVGDWAAVHIAPRR